MLRGTGCEAGGRWLLSGVGEQKCKPAKGPPFKAEGVISAPAKVSGREAGMNRSGNTGEIPSSLTFLFVEGPEFFYF